MLLPQFTLSRLLLGILIGALLLFCITLFQSDRSWMYGAAAAGLLLLASALSAALLFGLVYAMGLLTPFRRSVTPAMVPGAEQESPVGMRPANISENE
ncbi:MAG: hypothetical protein SFX18_04370 [Pirellulales bacterium]|nr:hypothetical protein [Pirellulales bacterium]